MQTYQLSLGGRRGWVAVGGRARRASLGTSLRKCDSLASAIKACMRADRLCGGCGEWVRRACSAGGQPVVAGVRGGRGERTQRQRVDGEDTLWGDADPGRDSRMRVGRGRHRVCANAPCCDFHVRAEKVLFSRGGQAEAAEREAVVRTRGSSSVPSVWLVGASLSA